MFEREYQVLSAMRQVPTDHLVKCLTAYKGGETSATGALLFPWAESDLTGFWLNNTGKHYEGWMHRWTFKQIEGIAKALRDLDDRFNLFKENVRHGDLKPSNILWFSDTESTGSGSLAIADAGLAKVHIETTSQRQDPTTTMNATEFYAPPEFKLGGRKPLSRKFDMWSMGCICMEAIIWLMYGNSELHRFIFGASDSTGQEKRKVYSFYSKRILPPFTAKVNPRVTTWMKHMLNDSRHGGRTAIPELLGVISKHLLVPKPKDRYSSKEFAEHMSSICQRIDNDELGIGITTPGERGPQESASKRLSRLWRRDTQSGQVSLKTTEDLSASTITHLK